MTNMRLERTEANNVGGLPPATEQCRVLWPVRDLLNYAENVR